MFNDDMEVLCNQVAGRDFDLIVGINRGGCIPAVCLSHHCRIPTTMVDYSTRDGYKTLPEDLVLYFMDLSVKYDNILLVDDLVDSGMSIKHLVEVATNAGLNVSVAVLLHNTDIELDVPVYVGTKFSRQEEPRYFDFWWETI